MLIDIGGTKINVAIDGPSDGPAVVFAHALGLNLHLWDAILPLMPQGLRVVRYDIRGHGASDVPAGRYSMGQLVREAEGVLDHFGLRDVAFVGISMGGMIAQGLAVKRLDQIRALVLSNTAAKFGLRSQWEGRIETVERKGISALVEPTLERWFPRQMLGGDVARLWGDTLAATDPAGYTGCCAAIGGTDFYTPTSGLRLPTLGIAGGHDGSAPPDLVRETVDLIPGARFELMRGSGHLPCVDDPKGYAQILTTFLTQCGHIPAP